MGKWATVTVTDAQGRRYSLDVNATSSYDAAHLYVTHVVGNPGCGIPKPTVGTKFEVVTDGVVLQVEGKKLKQWIERRRIDWNGPRGMLFSKRPVLE